MSAFEFLNALNVNGHTERKEVGGKVLTYLSWPWAWAEVKKKYPDASYTIWRNENGLPYTADPLTGIMVYTSVTIEGITHEMWLPVMDGANRAMKFDAYTYNVKNPKFKYAKQQKDGRFLDQYGNEQTEFITKSVDAATMMDINKTIMRCLVKNLAMFGLGLYIYAGEDLPEGAEEEKPENGAPAGNPATPAKRLDAPANVDKVAQLPQTPEKPGQYISRNIAEMALQFKDKGFDFMKTRAELIKAGLIEDVPSATMSMEQAENLINQIRAHYEKVA